MSRTWTELLGSPENCFVDGRYIVREISPGHRWVIWSFEDTAAAARCLETWRAENS